MIEPLVSVCITAYNHEEYIRQCLDSILNQKTNFEFEIIVGEDNSKDSTRAICEDYASRFESKIRLFKRRDEDKVKINGRITGRFNFVANLKETNGTYVAILDGDDYWQDEHKLQKQVDLAEQFNLLGVYGGYQILEDDGLHDVPWPFKESSNEASFLVSPEMIADHEFHFSHTSACFIHKNMIPVVINHPMIYKSFGVDELIMMELLSKGKVGFINSKLSVYRNTGGSATNWVRTFERRCSTYGEKFENFRQYRSLYPFFRNKLTFKIHFFAVHLINCPNFKLKHGLSALFYFGIRGNKKFTVKALRAFKKRIKKDKSL